MEKLRIIVSGFIGLYPTGGVTWDYIQYPLGLKLLGHDVFYIEDTRQYSTFQTGGKTWDDSSDSVMYLKRVMNSFGLENRWAYKDVASGNCFGLSEGKVAEICKTADVFINISEATFLSADYMDIPKRVLVDSDPMFTQVQFWNDSDRYESALRIQERYSGYTHLFTFGENIEAVDCRIPTFELKWIPTRQPICLDYWQTNYQRPQSACFTTIMNWSTRKKLKYLDENWGQKDVEFEKIIGLPGHVDGTKFEMVVSCSAGTPEKFRKDELEKKGWKILEPQKIIATSSDYKNFISQSLGEFSVAKEAYVKSNSGWFSCRSACYLALGRPVVTQDTSWSKYLPTGEGLLSFTNMDSAIEALVKVKADPIYHSKRARAVAEEFFDSNKVLETLLAAI